ncbi:MAG TPA: sugar phosphate isomerase/epimerase [Dehalococcoidia bacterium]|nr:sugar phosphate isomerase/epimerase [Dehalococcoidia bacterium]
MTADADRLQPPTSNLQPPLHALSTMWSQGRFPSEGHQRGADDMALFAEAAARLGYPHIEINYVIPPEGVEQLLSSNHVAVASLHSPTPRIQGADGRWSDALNLAALDEDERAHASRLAQLTVYYADRAGARFVVLHLGGAGDKMFEEERQLRRLYDQGVRDGAEVEALRARAAERRRREAPRFLEQARRSLTEIAERAARRGIGLGLENRYHFHEFPNPDEMHELLAGFPPDVAGFWLDIGHAEVLDRLGLIDKARWLDDLAPRLIGAHLHDVDGLADHRAPGHGSVDWAHVARALPAAAPRVLEINQTTPEDEVAAAIPFLRQRGILPT